MNTSQINVRSVVMLWSLVSVLPKMQFQNYTDLVLDVLGTNSHRHPSTGIIFIFQLGETKSKHDQSREYELSNLLLNACSFFSLYQSQTGVENPG